MALKLSVLSCGKAELLDQLLGRLPPRSVSEKFIASREGKLPFEAHESGKSGRLPFRVRFVTVCKEPRDNHVDKEQLSGRLALML